jgi:hypothetical protein
MTRAAFGSGLAVAAFALAAVPASTHSKTGWTLLASGSGRGALAIAEASVPGIPGPPAPNHRALRFHAATQPASLRIEVSWDLDCGSKHRGGGATFRGSFTRTFVKAPGCAGSLTADIVYGSGTVRVWIYGH